MYKDQTFSIYVIHPYHALQISGKSGSTLSQNLTMLSTLWVPEPTELQFSIIFFHSFAANQETNKAEPAVSFFSNTIWINCFELFSCKIRLQNSLNYCNENE